MIPHPVSFPPAYHPSLALVLLDFRPQSLFTAVVLAGNCIYSEETGKAVSKITLPGRKIEGIASEIKNINIPVQSPPTHVIIHAGTNNLPTHTSDQCIKNIKGLCVNVIKRYLNM